MKIPVDVMEGCLAADRKSQYRLYQLCFSMLKGVCRRYYFNEDEANAALNLGFLKILNKLSTRKENVPFEAWSKRIVINTIIDEFRKNKMEKEKTIYPERSKEPSVEDGIDFNIADQLFDAEDLEQMIRQLPAMCQKVFNLFAIDGYPHAEISGMLGISSGTSKYHLSTARKKLADMLKLKLANEKVKRS